VTELQPGQVGIIRSWCSPLLDKSCVTCFYPLMSLWLPFLSGTQVSNSFQPMWWRIMYALIFLIVYSSLSCCLNPKVSTAMAADSSSSFQHIPPAALNQPCPTNTTHLTAAVVDFFKLSEFPAGIRLMHGAIPSSCL
jgi:hypothetical protein